MPYEIDLILNRRGRSFYDKNIPSIKLLPIYNDLCEAMDAVMPIIEVKGSKLEFRIWEGDVLQAVSTDFKK